MTKFKYCYGPVWSWRLGRSLGIDPISRREKVCNFNCSYCQLGFAKPVSSLRRVYAPFKDVGKELSDFKPPIDYLTFSGRGEPTLAANVPELLAECRRRRKEKTAIITNASLISNEDVRKELSAFDFVIAKLDVSSEKLFKKINRPAPDISFEKTVEGLILFSKGVRGRLAIQTMLINSNKNETKELAALYAKIKPDEVELNTPLRHCAEKPISPEEMASAFLQVTSELGKLGVKGIKVIHVYQKKPLKVIPVSDKSTLIRRGKV
jgi:wyosine [tRNA(Phe)-imidazoG37] synthetase (radical SAM superfamily)